MFIFYVTTRYRMSLAPVAILLAGVGVDQLLRSWGDRKQTLQSAAIVAAIFALSLPPFMPLTKAGIDGAAATSWANLAVVFHMGDRIQESAQALETARRLTPNNPTFAMMNYDFFLQPSLKSPARQYEEAQKLVHAFPAHAGGYRRTAEALMNLSRPQDAIAQYEIAIGREPGDIHARLGLAEAYDSIGLRSQAVQVLQGALRIAPDNEEALEFMARLRQAGF